MNKIVKFRKCTLTDEQLIDRIDKMTDDIYLSGNIPYRRIPAEPNSDYDLLVGEMLIRYKEKILHAHKESQSVNGNEPSKELCRS